MELMPTAEAHYLLGKMDWDAGNRNSANDHFRLAAKSDSESGQRASRELLIQDLANNPSQYVDSRAEIDGTSAIWIRIENLTRVPIKDIEISYVWLDDQGQNRQGKLNYRGPLKGGQQDRVKTGIRLENTSDPERRFRAQVTAASLADR